MRHGENVKRCSHGGCTNYAQQGGVCIRHGADVKRCCHGGCLITLSKEESARGTGQLVKDAAMEDATTTN